jgi:hypothetical protein
MQPIEVHDYARRLFEAHGFKAVAEAARKASQLEQEGKADEALDWRQIEKTLISMRGPRAS